MRRVFRDDELNRTFHDQGFVEIEFLDDAAVQRLRALFDEGGSEMGTAFYTSVWSGNLDYRRRIHEAVTDAFRPAVDRLLADYRLCLGNFAVKRGGDAESAVPMHQDWSFVDESDCVTTPIWCPLVDVDQQNGCLAVIPRSHRLLENIRPNGRMNENVNLFDHVQSELNERIVEIPMKAGRAIVYSARLLHGSKFNGSSQARVAAVAVTVPREKPLRHYFLKGRDTLGVYAVNEDFYWRDVVIGQEPTNQEYLGNIAFPFQLLGKDDLAPLAR